ncbi:MAG: hypothetical protein ACOYKQ_02290 [Polymorphobacter sp.]
MWSSSRLSKRIAAERRAGARLMCRPVGREASSIRAVSPVSIAASPGNQANRAASQRRLSGGVAGSN